MKRKGVSILFFLFFYFLLLLNLTLISFSNQITTKSEAVANGSNDYITVGDLSWTFGYKTRDETQPLVLNPPSGFSYEIDSTSLHVFEKTGTFEVWAGAYAYVPLLDDVLQISFEGRARAGHVDPVNLALAIYNAESLMQIYYTEFIAWRGVLDTGYLYFNVTHAVEGLDEVILFFAYSDGYSANWGQEFWVRDLKIYNNVSKDFFYDKDVLTVFRSNSSEPRGLCWFQNHFWNVVTGTRSFRGIHKYTPDTIGDTVSTWSLEHLHSKLYGLTTDGEYLYLSIEKEPYIYKYDIDFVLQDTISLSISYASGLTYDGEYLWAANKQDQKIYKIDKDTGNTITSIPTPGESVQDIEFDGEFLWVIDSNDLKLYKISSEDGSVILSFDMPFERPQGLTIDGDKYLWITTTKDNFLCKLNIKAIEDESSITLIVSSNTFLF